MLARLRSAAGSLPTGEGNVRANACIALPSDDTCFLLVDASSSATVERLFATAGFSYERIVEAIQV